MDQPTVTCIMPTADRKHLIQSAVGCFLRQDYQKKNLIILDDGDESVASLINKHDLISYDYSSNKSSIGTKRNNCCVKSKGDIILHLDDDDWYSKNWVTNQVEALISSTKAICGLCDVNYLSTLSGERWDYRAKLNKSPWAYGATLAYWKDFWKSHPFSDMNTGEDNDFIFRNASELHVSNYTNDYLGIIHGDNAGIVMHEDPQERLMLSKWIKPIPAPAPPTNQLYSIQHFPKVSCIMPTANRAEFMPSAIRNFANQDYPNKELIIVDDGIQPIDHLVDKSLPIKYSYDLSPKKIGAKRNIACQIAEGEIIMHWDDDDWYSPNWISSQVACLKSSEVDICGLNQIQFYSPSLNKYWLLKNENSKRPWLSGQTLAYYRSFWQQHPFKDLQHGEDDDFVRNNGAIVVANTYYQGFMATLHANNTSNLIFPNQ